MLDTIHYTKETDGSFTKTVTHVEKVVDLQLEIQAMQEQLVAFNTGTPDHTPEMLVAIQNYTEQLVILQS
jgi:hypothetical protein